MSTFTFDEYQRTLKMDSMLVGRAVETIRKTVKLHGPRAVQAEIAALSPRQPVDRGTYKRSWRFEDIPGGAVMYNFSPHGSIIEKGRRPGKFPPIDKITEWVKRKKIGVASGPVGTRTATRGPGANRSGPRQLVVVAKTAARLSDAAARRIAYVIARAIAKRGLPPRLILQHASAVVEAKIREALKMEKAA